MNTDRSIVASLYAVGFFARLSYSLARAPVLPLFTASFGVAKLSSFRAFRGPNWPSSAWAAIQPPIENEAENAITHAAIWFERCTAHLLWVAEEIRHRDFFLRIPYSIWATAEMTEPDLNPIFALPGAKGAGS